MDKKFHENQTSGSRVVPYGRTCGRADLTVMTKPVFAFHNFTNAPENACTVTVDNVTRKPSCSSDLAQLVLKKLLKAEEHAVCLLMV